MAETDVTRELLREGWYRRCADEPNLTDHLGARNAIASLLDYIAAVEADLRAVAPVVKAGLALADNEATGQMWSPDWTVEMGQAFGALCTRLEALPPELLERLSAMEEA